MEETLREGLERRKIPTAVAMVATEDRVTYAGAFGKRDSASGVAAKTDSIFAIASMTKAITSTAALQLVEQGKLSLDEPAAKHLPELGKLEVLEGFDGRGKPPPPAGLQRDRVALGGQAQRRKRRLNIDCGAHQ